ncbi:MAG: hypothetical protein HYZ20_16245 [Burkholderiales bacterium]|nr:hypothetical protein [Burkholderiales bacterium]
MRKPLLALVLTILCVVAWKVRWAVLEEPTRSEFEAREAERLATPGAVPAAVASAPVVDTAEVLATIDWADPANPVALPISGTQFLLDTRAGPRVWSPGAPTLSPLGGAPAHWRLLEDTHMPASSTTRPGVFMNGMMFAVRTGATSAEMIWADSRDLAATRRMPLPEGFVPDLLLPLATSVGLLCSAAQQRSLVVAFHEGELVRLSKTTVQLGALQQLQARSVFGIVEGFGALANPMLGSLQYPAPPVQFDAQRCRWQANHLPEPLARAEDLSLLLNSMNALGNVEPAITAAAWTDAAGQRRTLARPLYWNIDARAWRERAAPDLPGLEPAALRGLVYDGLAVTADPPSGRYAFLDAREEQWRAASLRAPPARAVKLLRYGPEGVLALLIDDQKPGRIVRIEPVPPKNTASPMPDGLGDEDGVVPLQGIGVLLVGGHERLSNAFLIVPDAKGSVLHPLPESLKRVSGVPLMDGSIVVFGGLPGTCFSSATDQCSLGVAPGYRWLPVRQRWERLHDLKVAYAPGEALDGGNSNISSAWPRNDFLVREGAELLLLDGDGERSNHHPEGQPTRLMRWQLGGSLQPVARTMVDRQRASLVELADGRLAVIGGLASEPASPACQRCEAQRQAEISRLKARQARAAPRPTDEEVSSGIDEPPPCSVCSETIGPRERFRRARSCEIFDEANERFLPGPWAHHAGGRAVRLANGRIFKFGLEGWAASDGVYVAETADARLGGWTAAPPFPLPQGTRVTQFVAVGSQVLFVLDRPEDRLVIWDDETRSWRVESLPSSGLWGPRNIPRVALPLTAAADRLLLIHDRDYEIQRWPLR